ncbi:PrsW family intramembrane metalloprotease [Ruania alkalisoli]|uniref:PrsW family intramembrane metalloprotease n=1 Tax=Ruania alkalisoli TaxID=2779775 RepID=A0A7M1SND7_9MICO|nr:PrsW family intramembrane metalloprotease [Ruania alkalisoli]QOR69086.1 PrsW family intramembrane metalloprotease [Ruania alkalisoli]
MPLEYPPAYRPRRPGQAPASAGAPGASGWPAGPAGSAPPLRSGPVPQVWAPGQRTRNRFVFQLVTSIIGGLALLIALGYIALVTGLGSTSMGFVLALVPLAIVLAGVRWLDRWEPEPVPMLLVALLWGAGVAVLSALVLNTTAIVLIQVRTGDPSTADALGAVVVAPVVEELVKGAGVLLIFLVRRQHLDSPVDGVVYAATVGAGFAFTENILYFSSNAQVVLEVFVLRGLMSPFAHALFCACTGLAIGLAARSARRRTVLLAFPLGLLGAMALHALWNGSALFAANFFVVYALVQVPVFAAMVLLLWWLRRHEARIIRGRLGEYAQVGWFAPHEVDMLASLRLRSEAKTWATRLGERSKRAMVEFQRDATTLALRRQKVLLGRPVRADRSETELLEHLVELRGTIARAAAARGY